MVKELEQVMVKRFRIRYTVRDSVSWYCLSMSTEDINLIQVITEMFRHGQARIRILQELLPRMMETLQLQKCFAKG